MKKLFEEIPYLEDERIVIRKITDADADALEDMIRDDLIYRYEPSYLLERQYSDVHQVIRQLYGECFETKQNLILGIFLKENNAFCGLAEFYDYREELQKTCIGYRLREKYWGKGIATATARLMVNYLFTQTNIEIITASTMIENQASAHVLRKNGFIMTSSAIPEDWGHEQPTIASRWFR